MRTGSLRVAPMAAAAALSTAADTRPSLSKKGTGPSLLPPLHPLDAWHTPPPGGGMGLLHAGPVQVIRSALVRVTQREGATERRS